MSAAVAMARPGSFEVSATGWRGGSMMENVAVPRVFVRNDGAG